MKIDEGKTMDDVAKALQNPAHLPGGSNSWGDPTPWLPGERPTPRQCSLRATTRTCASFQARTG
jgi:hypothetical protein